MSRVRDIRSMLRAVGVSALLTMRLLQPLPDPAPRRTIAIMRSMTLDAPFDPREVLPSGAVLTMPLGLGGDRSRRGVPVGFDLN